LKAHKVQLVVVMAKSKVLLKMLLTVRCYL